MSLPPAPLFYVGLDDLHHAKHFERVFISSSRTRRRKKKPFEVRKWIMDSASFGDLVEHGDLKMTVREYADEIRRWAPMGTLEAAVTQDFMCGRKLVAKLLGYERESDLPRAEHRATVILHQRKTIERFDALLEEKLPVPIMPTLQGFEPADYVRHLESYGDRIGPGAWIGVGSIARLSNAEIFAILSAVKAARPDVRLHGLGVKKTGLLHPGIRALLFSADSMAWSHHARNNGRSAHDWREAERYRLEVEEAAGRPPALQLSLIV